MELSHGLEPQERDGDRDVTVSSRKNVMSTKTWRSDAVSTRHSQKHGVLMRSAHGPRGNIAFDSRWITTLVDPGPVFYVKDNGIGIEPKYHGKVLGLFERLDQSVEGTGVGLAVVHRIVEFHGGRIWVESEGVGTGSTFCFTLPAASGEA